MFFRSDHLSLIGKRIGINEISMVMQLKFRERSAVKTMRRESSGWFNGFLQLSGFSFYRCDLNISLQFKILNFFFTRDDHWKFFFLCFIRNEKMKLGSKYNIFDRKWWNSNHSINEKLSTHFGNIFQLSPSTSNRVL